MKIAILTPVFDAVHPACTASLLQALPFLRSLGFDVEWRYESGQLVHVARQRLAEQVFHPGPGGASACIMWDADQSAEPSELEALLAPIVEGRADLVGAAVAIRQTLWHRVAAAAERGERDPDALQRAGAHHNFELEAAASASRRVRALRISSWLYVPVHHVGFGLVAFTSAAYRRVVMATGSSAAAWCPEVVGGRPGGEDVLFCRRLTSAGGVCMANLSSRVRHHAGPRGVHVACADEHLRSAGFTFDVEELP